MSRAIGIDLGTTYSAMAVVGDDGAPRIIDNAEGEATTPSVVLFQDIDGKDSPMVGSMAKHMAASQPMDVVQFVKRHMGDPNWRFDSANYTYTPEEVSALILKRLKQDAEQALGGSIDDAVITVPAYFDDARRTSTKQAGQIAGFNVLRVLNEPTAAAISYGLDHDRDGVILVYDLGGGTFDVTALRVNGNDYEVLATDGNRNLGGFDFDNALMQIVADDVAAQGGEGLLADPVAAADLREKAEMAKRALSNVPQTSVYVTFQGNNYRVRVTRQAFEDATQSLINQTRDTVLDVMDDAGLEWGDVDHLLLVGGSSRMPMVREMMQELSGKRPETDVNPDEAVALGAAVQATLESQGDGAPTMTIGGGSPITIQDVTSQGLGTISVDNDTRQDINVVLIPRNTQIPCMKSEVFYTMHDNQQHIRVDVTQGDSNNPDFVAIIGATELQLPPHPEGSPVEIIYRYDIDQIVQVEVIDLTTHQSLGEFEIDRESNLDQGEVHEASAHVAGLTIE